MRPEKTSKFKAFFQKLGAGLERFFSAAGRFFAKTGKSIAGFYKQKKALAIILTVIIGLALIVGGGLLYYFRDMILGKVYGSKLGVYYGMFGIAPNVDEDSLYKDYSYKITEFENEIKAGMKESATPAEKATAAYIIYRIACLADATALQKAKYSVGSGNAGGDIIAFGNTITANCRLNVTASYYTLIYPFTKPSSVEKLYDGTYKAYIASEEYTQIPAGAVTGNNETLIDWAEPYLRNSFPFARKNIITPYKKVVWNGETSSCIIAPESATAEFESKKDRFKAFTAEELAQKEAASARPYPEDWYDPYGENARDVSIHIINPTTIIGDAVTIKKGDGIDVDGRRLDYYDVTFDIDCLTHRGTEESPTYYAEQGYLAQAPEAFINFLENYNIYYDSLKVHMTVFENGYFRTFGTKEKWLMIGGLKGGSVSATIPSDIDSTEAFCYDYDTIMQGFANRWFGDNRFVSTPASSLPFYDRFTEFTPQAYGTYR